MKNSTASVLPWALLLAHVSSAVACGGDSSSDSLTCSTVPACYANAVTALKACVSTSDLTMSTVTPTSGVIEGLTCQGGEVSAKFSAFSASPTGTVPVPATVTISKGGATCATLGTGTGSATDSSGNVRRFSSYSLTTPAGGKVELRRYQDGVVSLNCSPTERATELVASAGGLDQCPDAVVASAVTRNSDASELSVKLHNLDEVATSLFVCH